MKSITLLIVAFLAVASARYMTNEVKNADKEFMIKQKAIFEIFMNVQQPELHNHFYEEAQKFSFDGFKEHFTNAEAYEEFMFFYESHGFLSMEATYAPMQSAQNTQMMAVFKMFYYAKDWQSFYNFMVWARFHINSGMFVQSFTMAILHRDDMMGIVLPAIYEINPYYFFNNFVISKAHRVRMQGFSKMEKNGDMYTYTIPTNYTDYYVYTNEDSKVAYFMEDIGLNAYYYYWNMDYYSYVGGEEFGLNKDRRGEFYIYQMRQILARYYLERLSNGLGEIPEINYWQSLPTGYYSSMTFYNGVNFPSRENNYMMYLNKDNARYMEHLYTYEHRIFDAIDSGFFLMPNGEKMSIDKPENIEYLGNLIQMNKDTLGNMYYYGMMEMLAKKLLGGSVQVMDAYKQIPSVLELYETAMRDPMFYMFYKRMMHFNDAFIAKMPFYKRSDLMFEGVSVENVEIDKIITYFDKFYADITNAVDVDITTKDNVKTQMEFKVEVPRLNHVPFNVKMNVKSDKAQKSVVAMFVGPKYDSHGKVFDINDNRDNFWELDRWMVELTAGDNKIERNSADFTWFVNDRTTFYDLYKTLLTAIDGKGEFPLDMSEAHCGFPARLMMPRGRVGGFAVQFYFMVMPYTAPSTERYTGFAKEISCGVGSGARFLDNMPFGYPFNRQFDSNSYFTPNQYFFDTFVYHKMNDEIKTYY